MAGLFSSLLAMLPFLESSSAGAGAMSALTPMMASQLPSWLNPADVAGVMPTGSSGGLGSLFSGLGGGGSSNSIDKLLKVLGPALGGGQQRPSPPSLSGTPPIGIMQPKPFQPITGQPIGGATPTGGGSQAQTIQALLALLNMGNSAGGM